MSKFLDVLARVIFFAFFGACALGFLWLLGVMVVAHPRFLFAIVGIGALVWAIYRVVDRHE